MAQYLTVGKVARRSGVNLQTVLYYERRRLLVPVRRTDSGYRLYTPEAIRVIRFVKNAQGLGFTLEEIARLLRLRVGRRVECGKVKGQAQARLRTVQDKIAGLRAMEKALKRLILTCSARRTTDQCPILESLEEGRVLP